MFALNPDLVWRLNRQPEFGLMFLVNEDGVLLDVQAGDITAAMAIMQSAIDKGKSEAELPEWWPNNNNQTE